MTWMKWLPWRYAVRRLASKHGFLDPFTLLTSLYRFSQPSEVGEPIELLRAGVVFHARGLINSRVIQHNLDWVWPYWIERQFNPLDKSFIPRAFSITHINLSHRNWTAIGYPDCEELPIVDPRGLLTPFFDGWSLQCWLQTEDGRCLLPSRLADCRQTQDLENGVRIITESSVAGLQLTNSAWMELADDVPTCKMQIRAEADAEAWLVLALRPYNPEGISFIHETELAKDRLSWTIDQTRQVIFNHPAERHHISDYRQGDVHIHLNDREEQATGRCDVGMITAAALFRVGASAPKEIIASVPFAPESSVKLSPGSWNSVYDSCCKLTCPDARYTFLYDAAVASLILHSPGDVYPGPFTYKRFWFRDAAFIIHALLCVGLSERAERALGRFPERQTALGYFQSQKGEWDSNGQVLWILQRFYALTGQTPPSGWHGIIKRAARWIMRKRLAGDLDTPHAGLLPAGFSAEHLGPNDYYYWDDFWGIAGLRAATILLQGQDKKLAQEFSVAADDFSAKVSDSLASCAQRLGREAMPASPYRRLDAGAIGSLAFGYPTQLAAPNDPRLLECVDFLLEHCMLKGAFYQDMVHSGLNAYLTLHIAQILLRAGDPGYLELMDAVADLASSTGQWPEAVHPGTGGGCMGDGHHVWASSEWVLMIRNCFVREEQERLVLCAGIPERWLQQTAPISFGPAPTAFGAICLTIFPEPNTRVRVDWHGDWHGASPVMEIRLPGYKTANACTAEGMVTLDRKDPGA